MNKKPLVSIFCITYNHENYIKQALDGFINQNTNFQYEILINDDCSTDNTTNILKEYESKYPDLIKVFYHDKNEYSQGKSVLTKLFEFAKGEYIAYCEGDDYWINKNKLQIQIDALKKNPECGFCCTDVNVFFENINKFDYAIGKHKKAYIDFNNPINSKGYLFNVTWVIKKDIFYYVTQKKTNFKCIDIALKNLYEICLTTKGIYIDTVTSVYRRAYGSLSCFSDNEIKKRYEYNKSLLILQKEYLKYFPMPEATLNKVLLNFFKTNFQDALNFNDKEIIAIYTNYISSTNFNFIYQLLQEKSDEIKQSKYYKFGLFILSPIKNIYKVIKGQ